jgi:hypothetical protein
MFVSNCHLRSHGLAVRTLDSESSNPSSNLGGTYFPCDIYLFLRQPFLISLVFLLKNKSDNSIVQLRMFDFAFLQRRRKQIQGFGLILMFLLHGKAGKEQNGPHWV